MHYYCEHCKKTWIYPVEKCIFCGKSISQKEETKYKVIDYTEVRIPSPGNEKVPYFVNILEDNNKQKLIRKSWKKYEIGDLFSFEMEERNILTIGIIGTGLLGIQLTAYMLQFGYPTLLRTREEKNKINAVQKVRKILSKQFGERDVNKLLENFIVTTDYSVLKKCDLVIEAVAEDLQIKKDVFLELSKVCSCNTILATNSSSLSIEDISSEISHPDRCIGMHFFNPVQKIDLVEVIIGKYTSKKTKEIVMEFASNLNKKPILIKDSPGYIVNRLLLPQINEAIHILESGIATKEDIDNAVKLGLNHPMGPLQLADFIGLDICLSILEVLSKELDNEKYHPAKMLYMLVNDGKLGYKTREGFYKY